MKSSKRFIGFIMMLCFTVMLSVISVSASEHKHSFSVLYTVKPTCTEDGYTVFSCDCGYSYESKKEKAYGHDFSDETVCFEKSTCISEGKVGRYCKRCYAGTDVAYLDKAEHTPVYNTTEATLKKNGKTVKECSVCKKHYSTKKIYKISSVKLEEKSYTYDGKVKTPDVIVKDSEGKRLTEKTDYTLKYQKGRKKTGIYTVKVTFKGNYKDSKVLCFTIAPTAVKKVSAIPSITSVTLSWGESAGADGYEIYVKGKKLIAVKNTAKLTCKVSTIDGKKLKSGTDYTFVIKAYKNSGEKRVYSLSKKIKFTTKPAKIKVKSVKVSSGKAVVTLNKTSCHGYELLLSSNKSFSNPQRLVLKGSDKTSVSFKNISKGKKYYVKARAFVTSGGKKYYGYYSDVKSFKR